MQQDAGLGVEPVLADALLNYVSQRPASPLVALMQEQPEPAGQQQSAVVFELPMLQLFQDLPELAQDVLQRPGAAGSLSAPTVACFDLKPALRARSVHAACACVILGGRAARGAFCMRAEAYRLAVARALHDHGCLAPGRHLWLRPDRAAVHHDSLAQLQRQAVSWGPHCASFCGVVHALSTPVQRLYSRTLM